MEIYFEKKNSSNLFLPFFFLIVVVKEYVITCFFQKLFTKNVKNSTKDSDRVLRNSKCWTQALKIKASYIIYFINKAINNRRDI